MNNHQIWNLFLQTGNVEAYLLLKQLENEQTVLIEKEDITNEEIASMQTKM